MVLCFLAWTRVSFPVLPSSFQIANYIFSSSFISLSFPDAPSSGRFPSLMYYTCSCLLWRIWIWNLPATSRKPPHHNSENASVARHSAQCISEGKPGPQLCITSISPASGCKQKSGQKASAPRIINWSREGEIKSFVVCSRTPFRNHLCGKNMGQVVSFAF